MATRIAFAEDQFDELARALDANEETAAVIGAHLVGVQRAGGVEPSPFALTLTSRTLSWVPQESYESRSGTGLSISSTGWVPAFRAAVADDLVPVFLHTHPGGDARFSGWDDEVDEELAAAAEQFGARAYASVVLAGRHSDPTATARLYRLPVQLGGREDPRPGSKASVGDFEQVEAVRVAGVSVRLLLPPAGAPEQTPDAETFDRQVRMLGADGQRTLRAVRAAVIGVGGTGSAVAVQLARLGVGKICLVDDDDVTAPTPTRGHGIRATDVGRRKVDVLGEYLRDIGLGTEVIEIGAPLHDPIALRAIEHADVVFSCVDGHGARLILNRFAYAHLAAVIDLAVLVTVTDPDLEHKAHVEVDERVTWLAPGTACLLCRGRIDAAVAFAENLDPEARRRLAGEGYVAAAETPQPAVVTLTTQVAALATTEFLMRLAGIGSAEATELLLRPHLGELRRNRMPQRPGCFCQDKNYVGRGQRGQYLDLMWLEPPFEQLS